MEDRIKQTEAFARMLELMKVPVGERPQVMRGVDLFFDRGWPSNRFTVGMAARAGAGLVPPLYEAARPSTRLLWTRKMRKDESKPLRLRSGQLSSSTDSSLCDDLFRSG